jgi:ribonuclease Z
MRLHLLGTAGYHPSDTRQTACVMLPELGIVLDAGTGFYRVRNHLSTNELDIFLSHSHLDHVVGLSFWFDVVHERRIDRATVHGLPEKLAAVREHLLSEHLFPAPLPYEYRPLTPVVALPGDGKLTHFPLIHPGGATGYRLDWPGRSLAYVTDTSSPPDASYVEHLHGVDILIHECNFRDGNEEFAQLTGHSCTTQVAQVAKRAGVGRLVLVHMNPLVNGDDPIGLETARKIFPNTVVGHDGMVVEF